MKSFEGTIGSDVTAARREPLRFGSVRLASLLPVVIFAARVVAQDNLALNKPASSSGANWGTFKPAALTDGVPNTFTHPLAGSGTLDFYYQVDLGRFGLYGASMFESISGGLGTAAFLAFLMNVCDKEHATVQYAFLSSVFSLTGRLIGGISGLGAEKYGYGNYFAITFLLALPAYLLLPWVKQWIHEDDRHKERSRED